MAEAKARGEAKGPRAFRLRIWRGGAGEPSRVDDFEVLLAPEATVHAALLAVRARPITLEGRRVDPPVWDVGCLEGSCGSCTVRVGGRAVLACEARIGDVQRGREPISIEPLGRFPVVRDLVVDRSRQDEALARVRLAASAPPEVDGPSPDPDRPPVIELPAARELRSALAACIGCGACVEACPETGAGRPFVGPEAIASNRLARLHPRPDAARDDALARALMGRGGVADCANAQACVEACPADVPLVEAIADAARETSTRFLFGWMRR